jgi:hypothetical protein
MFEKFLKNIYHFSNKKIRIEQKFGKNHEKNVCNYSVLSITHICWLEWLEAITAKYIYMKQTRKASFVAFGWRIIHYPL